VWLAPVRATRKLPHSATPIAYSLNSVRLAPCSPPKGEHKRWWMRLRKPSSKAWLRISVNVTERFANT